MKDKLERIKDITVGYNYLGIMIDDEKNFSKTQRE